MANKKCSEETKKKISETLKRKKLSPPKEFWFKKGISPKTSWKKGNLPWNKDKENCFSNETIEKMRKSRKGFIPWNKGIHYHLEHSATFKKGAIPWNKGKKGVFKHSEEWKDYMSKKLTGSKRDLKTRLKMSLSRKGQPNNNIYHIKYDKGKKQFRIINGKQYPLSNINWMKANNIHRVPFSNDRNGGMIHHIDGDRENNNPENLQLMTRDFHFRLHYTFNKMLKNEGLNG